MVSHINRAVTIEGTITKHKRALNPHGPYTVPRSLDGFSRASSEYLPIAHICHRGPTHDTGHYFATLVYKDLMWIADDGGTPKVLHFLTPQLAGQIVQVWGIQASALVTPRQIARALPEPETPDYDPPLHGTPPKRPSLHKSQCASMWPISPPLGSTHWSGYGVEIMNSMSWLRHTWTAKNITPCASILKSGADMLLVSRDPFLWWLSTSRPMKPSRATRTPHC